MSSIATPTRNLKVLCVLYPDPVTGYPKSFPRDEVPKITSYPNGQTLPAPKGIDFVPGTLLGSVSGELGLRKYIGKIKVLIDIFI
jgi:formate dehydrogenase